MEGITIYIVLGVVVSIIYLLATAFFTNWLAEQKGYNNILWGTLGFFFGIAALLTIGFAQKMNLNVNRNVENIAKNWNCPKCNNENSNSTYQCKNCGYKLM